MTQTRLNPLASVTRERKTCRPYELHIRLLQEDQVHISQYADSAGNINLTIGAPSRELIVAIGTAAIQAANLPIVGAGSVPLRPSEENAETLQGASGTEQSIDRLTQADIRDGKAALGIGGGQ